jgi:drug/metabolite transporter (DMT)-like permease
MTNEASASAETVGQRTGLELTAYLALAAAVGGVSWSALFVRWAEVPGIVSAFYRVLFAGAVLIPWRLARGPTHPVSSRTAWTAVAGGVFFALDLALWNTAVMRTQAAIATVLGNNTPVFVGIMAWLAFRRTPRRSFWAGLALAVTGCVLIISTGSRLTTAPGTVSGNLLALAASMFFGAYLLTTERIRVSMDTLTFSTLAIVGSVATLFVICVASGLPLGGHPARTWAALAGLGLISQLGAYYALVYALGHLPATITSVGLLAQVPSTALLAMLLLDEPLTPVQVLGGAIVLMGIYVVNSDPGRTGPV